MFRAALRASRDFEKSYREVQALFSYDDTEVERLKAAALELSRRTPMSPSVALFEILERERENDGV